MNVSIKELINKYATGSKKTWRHDRSLTVGASEVGACMRKTWFSKHSEPHDVAYVDDWGARFRGTVMEDAFIVPALKAGLKDTEYTLLYAGEGQQTLKAGYLSGTPDGLLVDHRPGMRGWCVNLEFKTIDPRADISKEKSLHHFQTQAQMGLWSECTAYTPAYSIITYVNASFWDVIDEFHIKYDPRIYKQAHVRAERIMTAKSANELPPEGKIEGGAECKHCPWASHCQDIVAAGVPRAKREISDDDVVLLKAMRDAAIGYAEREDRYAKHRAEVQEQIKQFLRDKGTRGHKGEGWGVSYTVSAGRKEGKQSERLTVK